MLPPEGWPGLSNPSGTTTWTRTMLPPARAPARLTHPPSSGDLNHTRRRSVIPDTGWYGEAVDTVRPEAIGVRSHGRGAAVSPAFVPLAPGPAGRHRDLM